MKEEKRVEEGDKRLRKAETDVVSKDKGKDEKRGGARAGNLNRDFMCSYVDHGL
jgi:hypothetical protein